METEFMGIVVKNCLSHFKGYFRYPIRKLITAVIVQASS